MPTDRLQGLGWSPSRSEEFVPYAAEGCAPARVVAQHRGAYVVAAEAADRPAEIAGHLRHSVSGPADLPAVGDWVAVKDAAGAAAATVHGVLTRRTVFARKAAGEGAVEQIVAANVDVVFLVGALGPDLNVRRLERYLAAGWESGAEPVVVLNKCDLEDDLVGALAAVEAVAFGVPVHVASAVEGTGVEELARYLAGNRTVALLGSSGAGKSSLVNRLLGHDRQDVAEVKSDGRGRHTTTRRELLPVPGGGLVLDTPGMRELGLWEAGGGVEQAFAEIADLAAACRFRDCAHETEPGCAVRAAIEDGRLDPDRLASYRKLLRELARLEVKTDGRALAEQRRKRRRFARSLRRSAY
ncbi:MAG TPA: ribosome small subunit-dependent GTPase A [Gaiellaceae bacterium]|nr:ribosome small subunit-dependent GTPase A [Gaiellaceae bacterium]